MQLIVYSVICALAVYGLLDLLFMMFLPLELFELLHERYIIKAHKKLLEKLK